MATAALLAVIGIVVVAITDTLLALRVLRAYRASRRSAHLVIVLGITASFVAVVGIALVLAIHSEPTLTGTTLHTVARWLSFTGAGLAYGFVGVFASLAFGERVARGIAVLGLVGLLGIGGHAAETDASVATPATMDWALRVPFVAIAIAGSLYGAVSARRLARLYEKARAAGRDVDRVALARMRTMGGGFFAMSASQLALAGFAPHGAFDTPLGFSLVGVILLGALVFVLACVATWSTPAWLRARWERS